EDGISAVQTAEGALTEVHDMLQRMNELAVKAANGTNSEDDRAYIQDEIDQLSTEIDRVAETTKFNETYLLKGDPQADAKAKQYSYAYALGGSTNGTAEAAATVTMTQDTASGAKVTKIDFEKTVASAEQNALAKAIRDQGITISSTTVNGAQQVSVKLNGSDAQANFSVEVDGNTATTFYIKNAKGDKVATITGAAVTKNMSATITASSVSAAVNKSEVFSYYDKDGNAISANDLQNYFTASGDTTVTTTARADANKVYDALGKEIQLKKGDVVATKDKTATLKMKFHVGADGTANNQITVNIDAMSAKGLGINGIKVDGADDSNATKAISTIAAAVKMVSTQRSALGAVQNRLEHTINNLDNVVENTTAAESQIRDTDMATEMVKYSNANILSQAGQSMLAQANQSNQGVLSLLG
ncbi:MAG: flagellar hook protein, partial [Lachnospiraceae bacterium]|nr:flagellar hook protein [Lachnospiraceae bacterium]